MAKVALLIGVSNYGSGFQALPGTPKDVEAIRGVLAAPHLGGFDQVNSLIDPDPFTMQEAIEVLFSSCQADDVVLLFFSGHGIKDDQGALYLGTRLTRTNEQGHLMRSTAVPARLIHEFMNSCPAKQQVVIVDCCFSGAFADRLATELAVSAEEGLPQPANRERIVLASSTAAQYSLTSMQYSYMQLGLDLSTYTYYLVEGIETGAADQDGDGAITISELYEYAKRRVQIAAPAMEPELYASPQGCGLKLIRAPAKSAQLTYRQEVESWLSNGNISAIGRTALEVQQQNLGLQPDQVAAIEAAVLRPYREYKQRSQRYEQVFLETIQREHALSVDSQAKLKRLREVLGLTEAGVGLTTLQMEEYGRCLQRYEQALIEVVRHDYPLNHYAYQELKQLQQVLGLSDQDVAIVNTKVEAYKQRLQRYEKALVETVQQQYPLNEASCMQLKRLQQALALEDEDITPIILRVEAYKKRLHQYRQEIAESIVWKQPIASDQPPLSDLPFWQTDLGFRTDAPARDANPIIPPSLHRPAVQTSKADSPATASQVIIPPPIDQRIAQESEAIKSERKLHPPAKPDTVPPVNATQNSQLQEPPAAPLPQAETPPAPISPVPQPNQPAHTKTSALLGVLCGILVGSLGCWLLANFLPQPSTPLKQTIPSGIPPVVDRSPR